MNKTYIIGGVVVLAVIGLGAYFFSGSATPAPSVPAPVADMNDYHDNIYLVGSDAAKGSYITDFQKATLYTFDKDQPGISNCADACAKAWPPYTSGATAQKTFPRDISVITRADGSAQFAYKGQPLYYYSGDKNPGDVNGDGVEGTWHIVKM